MNFYKFLLISIIILAAEFFGFTICAQNADSLGMSVAPQVFELNVFPGEIIKEKIKLKNLSEVPLPILVKTADFTAQEDSGEMEFDESLQDPVIASRKWFGIEKPNFILEANEEEAINFEISVPADAEPGGHYSVIFFEPQLPSFYFKPGAPKTIPVIGVLFLISVKTLSLEAPAANRPMEIVEFRIPIKEKNQNLEKALASIFDIISSRALAADTNIVENPPSGFILKIKNNDIFHHKLNGKVSIYNFLGKKVGESEIKKTTVLPGKVRQFPVSILPHIPDFLKFLPAESSDFLIKNSFFGKYRVVLNLSEEKNQISLDQTISFWALPWKTILALFAFSLVIIIIRKRMFRAMKALLKL